MSDVDYSDKLAHGPGCGSAIQKGGICSTVNVAISVREARSRLTDVEATAAQVALYRTHAAHLLLRPDTGLPYYDGSYDRAIVDACLPPEEQSQLLLKSDMLTLMTVRTAEIDHHLMAAVGGVAQPAAVGTAAAAAMGAVGAGTSSNLSDKSRSSISSSWVEGVRQVVLLGAGLDPRAWRLPFPLAAEVAEAEAVSIGGGGDGEIGAAVIGTVGGDCGGGGAAVATGAAAAEECGVTVFELDSGTVEALKTRVLGSPVGCRRVFVRADLEAPQHAVAALAAAGHDPRRVSVFVLEGLIGYLTSEAGDALLAALRAAAAPGSLLLMTVPPSPAWRDELAARGTRLHHTTFEEAGQTLARAVSAGWEAELLGASALGIKYGMEGSRLQALVVGRC